jgi:hypothetical protein
MSFVWRGMTLRNVTRACAMVQKPTVSVKRSKEPKLLHCQKALLPHPHTKPVEGQVCDESRLLTIVRQDGSQLIAICHVNERAEGGPLGSG